MTPTTILTPLSRATLCLDSIHDEIDSSADRELAAIDREDIDSAIAETVFRQSLYQQQTVILQGLQGKGGI